MSVLHKSIEIMVFSVVIFLFLTTNSAIVIATGTASGTASSSIADYSNPLQGLDMSTVAQLNPTIFDTSKPGASTISLIIGNIIGRALQVIGAIALAMFVYGGFVLMTGSTTVAGGATKKDVSKAKAIIVWSALGFIVILASYIIVSFVFQAFK